MIYAEKTRRAEHRAAKPGPAAQSDSVASALRNLRQGAAQLQAWGGGAAGLESETASAPTTRRADAPNATGLPEALKSGVESLSGYSLDDVRVHYNSPAPARLQAHAYTQGTEIHVAPGQEKHLPHEAWHVVQQMRGRVEPTRRLQGSLRINDDAGLEKEAEQLGNKAAIQPARAQPLAAAPPPANPAIQRSYVLSGQPLGAFVAEQTMHMEKTIKSPFSDSFTTVGFEHEFAQIAQKNSILHDMTHLELARSAKLMPRPSSLPFIFETDAADAIELVSPPFIIETVPGTTVPNPDTVAAVDAILQKGLTDALAGNTLGGVIDKFQKELGWPFHIRPQQVKAENINPGTAPAVRYGAQPKIADIFKLPLKLSGKRGRPGIGAQVNFAADAAAYDAMKRLSEPKPDPRKYPETVFYRLETGIYGELNKTAAGLKLSSTGQSNFEIFLRELARNLSQAFAVYSVEAVKTMKESIFSTTDINAKPTEQNSINRSTNKLKDSPYYNLHTGLRSYVKDTHGVWLKDNIFNFALGLLSHAQWADVQTLLTAKLGDLVSMVAACANLEMEQKTKAPLDELQDGTKGNADRMRELAQTGLTRLLKLTGNAIRLPEKDLVERITDQPTRPDFGGHHPDWLGVRQDTYIKQEHLAGLQKRTGKRHHVLEARGDDPVEQIRALAVLLEQEAAGLGPSGASSSSTPSHQVPAPVQPPRSSER